jgi:hypothetical protein
MVGALGTAEAILVLRSLVHLVCSVFGINERTGLIQPEYWPPCRRRVEKIKIVGGGRSKRLLLRGHPAKGEIASEGTGTPVLSRSIKPKIAKRPYPR